MAELIDKGAIYNKVAELEELARNRVLDTSSNNPYYIRYVSQLNERTALKHLIADTEDTTEVEIRKKVINEFIKKLKTHPHAQYHLDKYLLEDIYEIAEQLKEE